MRNRDYLDHYHNNDALKKIEAARRSKNITYADLADKINVNKVWLVSALKGQQWVPEEYANALAKELGLSQEEVAVLQDHPYKGDTDPILYRLHEMIDTYGPALKALIHEQGGNAIMSAIDFSIDFDIVPEKNGDRIIIKFDGKLLPYSKDGKYPW